MEIRTLFSTDTTAIDEAIDSLEDMGDAGRESGRDISGGMENAERSTGVLQSALKGLGVVLATIGIATFAGDVVEAAREMGNAIGEVASLGVNTDELKSLSDAALATAGDYGVMASDFVSASYDIQSAISGLNPGELGTITASMSTLAIGTKSTTEVMTSMMGTMYGIFQGAADKMGVGEFSKQVAAMTAKSVQAFKTTGSAMSQAFTTVGAIGEKMGATMSEQFAVLGTLQATMPGAEAGTKYKAFMEGVIGAQKKLGLSFVDSQGKMLPTVDILEKLKGKFGDLNAIEIAEIKKGFGSSEATAFVTALIGKTDQLKGSIDDVAGADFGLVETMASSIADPFDKAAAAANALKIKLGNLILPTVNAFMEQAATAATYLTNNIDSAVAVVAAFIEKLKTGDGVFAAVRTGFESLSAAVAAMLPYIAPVAEAFGAVVGVMLGSQATWAIVAGGVGLVATAVKALSAAVKANFIVMAITAIATAAYLLYEHWDAAVVWWNDLWSDMQSAAEAFSTWWSGTTFEEKALDVATVAVEAARATSEAFFGWWDQSTLKQHAPGFVVDGIETAKQLSGQFFNWWDTTTLTEKIADIKAGPVASVKQLAGEFVNWWSSTNLVEKVADVQSLGIETARSASESFFTWWDQSTLKQHSPTIVTSAMDAAREHISAFFTWWDSTTLVEKISDVTFETLTWAWEKAQAFSEWWSSWTLTSKNLPADASVVEKAWDIAQRFVTWWNSTSLKDLLPDVGGMVDSMKSVGSDAADGFAEGWSRFKNKIKGAVTDTAADVEDAARTRLDTHSPSRVMAAVGMDVSTGFADGIESGSKKVKSAAERAAEQAERGFMRIVEGLEKQYLKLTEGEEAARRYELGMQGITGANQEAIIAAEAQIKSLEDQNAAQAEAERVAKQSADAQVQAAKQAADEQVRAAKQIQDAIKGLNQNIEKQVIAFTQGEEAARQYELGLQNITGSAADAIIAGEQHVKALQQQKQAAEAAAQAAEQLAKAVQGIQQGIEKELISLNKGEEAARRYELGLKGIVGSTQDTIIAGEAQVKALKDQIAAKEAATQAAEQLQKALDGIHDGLKQQVIALTQGEEAARRYELGLQGIEGANADAVIAAERHVQALQKQKQAAEDAARAYQAIESELSKLTDQQKLLEIELSQGVDAAKRAELGMKGYSESQINAKLETEAHITEMERLRDAADGIGSALVDGLLSGDWKSAGKQVLGILSDTFITPLKDALSKSISTALTGGDSGGGLMGSIGKLFGGGGGAGGWLGGISTALGGVGSSISGALSGLMGSLGGGLGGIGSALAGGLGGIGSSLMSLAAAMGPVGWAAAAAAALAGIFGGPSDPELNFTQGAKDGQKMLDQGGKNRGQLHAKTGVFGTIGGTAAGSNKIGREEGFVPKFHAMMDGMLALDQMIADTLPGSIDNITAALEGVEMKGMNTSDMLKKRYQTVFSALPEELKHAMQGGQNIMGQSAEVIVARFQEMAAHAQLTVPVIEQLGLRIGDTSASAIAASLHLSDAAGGLDALHASLDKYYQFAYTAAERENMLLETAQASIDEFNASLGLTGVAAIDTAAELRAYIESQDATTAAGAAAIAAALAMIDAMAAVSGTADDAANSANDQSDANEALADTAAAAADSVFNMQNALDNYNNAVYTSAEREALARADAQAAVDAFNSSLGLSGAAMIDTVSELRAYYDALAASGTATDEQIQAALEMTDAIVILSGTADDLAQAANDAAYDVAGLRSNLSDLVSQLYGSNTSSNSSSTTDNGAAAAQAELTALKSRYDVEKTRIAELNSLAQEQYQAQLDHYRSLKSAAQDLQDFVNGWSRDNPMITPLERLQEAQIQYNATLAAAQGGDVEASAALQSIAGDLQNAYGDAYGSTASSAAAMSQITDDLSALAGTLDAMAGAEPNEPADISSTLLATLERQIAAQESLASSLQSSQNSSNAAADRTALAAELAENIGDLGLAMDVSVFDLLRENGIALDALATDFGIDLNTLDQTFASKIAELSGLLHTDSLTLINELGADLSELASSFGVDVSTLNNTFTTELDALASGIGALDSTVLNQIDSMADALHVDSVSLADALGANIDQMGDLIAGRLGSLPDMPSDIRDYLAPYLNDIENANDPESLRVAIAAVQGAISGLPPDIRAQLNNQLDNIVGHTGGTQTAAQGAASASSATTNAVNANTNVANAVKSQATWIASHHVALRGQIAAGVVAALSGIRQTLWAQNRSWGKSGNDTAALNTYAVGSDSIPHDQIAQIHAGESIFTARQTGKLRDDVSSAFRLIPAMSKMVQNSANQPRVINVQTGKNSNDDELVKELRELRRELKSYHDRGERRQFENVSANKKTARILDTWEQNGMPPTEEEAA